MEGCVMAKVSVVALDAAPIDNSAAFGKQIETRAIFNREKDPIHLHSHRVKCGEVLRIAGATDCLIYVWQGDVRVGERPLAAGSSVIVEHGSAADITGSAECSLLLTFAARQLAPNAKPGGHVHVLPNERVPRFESEPGSASSVGGGLHADSSCSTCSVWLHENKFPPPPADAPSATPGVGIHSHTEDEIIFVTAGEIRLGSRLHGPGTAVAIAANTLYSFTPGPNGLSFINFRADAPGDIHFQNGLTMDEVGFWRGRLGTPQYLSS